VHDLLDIIARYEMVLATGHLAPEEQQQLVPEARRRGIKTVITHARVTPVPVGVTAEFSQRGAFVEHSYIIFIAGMLQQGFEDAEVRRMVQDNPATLLGIA